MSPQHDPVNHPSHYTQGKVECIEALEAMMTPAEFIAALRFQVVKYTWRLGRKGASLECARKAQWYTNLLVQKLEEQANV